MPLQCFICPQLLPIQKGVIRDSICHFAGKITEVTSIEDAKVIICQPVNCIRYAPPVESCNIIFLVSQHWILNSVLKQHIEPFYPYYPDANLIFSGLSFDMRHLDDCTMTDFYSEVVMFFGGRVISDSTEHATHVVMETKPFEASELHLASPKCAASQIVGFLDNFLSNSGRNEASSSSENVEMASEIRSSVSSHTVSYSWLDACITQRTKLCEDAFYTHSKECDTLIPVKSTKIKKNRLADNEFLDRINTTRPLQGFSLLISRRFHPTQVQGIGDAAEWLGATVAKVADIAGSDGNIIPMIVPASSTIQSGTITSRPFVSPYYVAKLLRSQGKISGPFGVPFPSDMTNAMQSFLTSIYCPRPRRISPHSTTASNVNLFGCIFAISGFGDSVNNCVVPSRRDIAASVSILGGHTACMVEGITSYLVCETMCGEKYKIAKRWGETKIRVVHWKWLMRCMEGAAVEPFEEDIVDDAAGQLSPEVTVISDRCCADEGEVEVDLSPRGVAVEQRSQQLPVEFNFYASEPSQATDTDTLGIPNITEPVDCTVGACCSPVNTPSCISQVQVLETVVDHRITHEEQSGEVEVEVEGGSNRSMKRARVCPVFLFGGGTEEQFQQSRTMVESLGGSVVWPVENCYDPRCTHLLLWKMTRTEKYLCACAAGKWILHPEYLSACHTALQGNPSNSSSGNFLSEGEYEWGHEIYAASLTGGQGEWARAGRRSRMRPNRPFSTVRALIFGSTSPPAETLKLMVVSGGGSAVIVSDLSAALLHVRDECEGDGGRRSGQDGSGGRGVVEGGEQQISVLTARSVHRSLRTVTTIIASSRTGDDEKHLRELCAMLASWGVTVPVQSPSHLLDSLCGLPPADNTLDSSAAGEKNVHCFERDENLEASLVKGSNTSKRIKLSK